MEKKIGGLAICTDTRGICTVPMVDGVLREMQGLIIGRRKSSKLVL